MIKPFEYKANKGSLDSEESDETNDFEVSA